LREIEVTPGRSGKPVLSLNGWTEKIGRRRRVCQYTVSISHSGDFAVACVILTTKDPDEQSGRE
jgi:phosphopantetheinyl transferase (holo-ACP synthase)